MLLDFRHSDGTIKYKSLYNFLKKHPNDPEALRILNTVGETKAAKYRNYLNFGSVEAVEPKLSDYQELDYEAQVGVSSKILDVTTPLTDYELLKQHGYNPDDWQITKHQCSKWNSGSKQLMSSKIFVKPRNVLEGQSKECVLEAFNRALGLEPFQFKEAVKSSDSKLLVLPISDLHFGLLAEEKTSGNVYNMEIAAERLQYYVSSAIKSTKLTDKDTILITFGNDFFNCDNVQGTTTRGTAQNNEMSYLSTWDKGVNLGVSTIEYLLNNTPCRIEVANVQGNHDLQSSHAMLVALHFAYKAQSRVRVHYDSDTKARFYYKYGSNLIGFGHETKIKECHRIMSSECPEWSNVKYRTMFLGHLHSEEVIDTGALVVRRIPTLSGKSTWTDSMGYAAHPRAQAFVFEANKGLTTIFNIETEN